MPAQAGRGASRCKRQRLVYTYAPIGNAPPRAAHTAGCGGGLKCGASFFREAAQDAPTLSPPDAGSYRRHASRVAIVNAFTENPRQRQTVRAVDDQVVGATEPETDHEGGEDRQTTMDVRTGSESKANRRPPPRGTPSSHTRARIELKATRLPRHREPPPPNSVYAPTHGPVSGDHHEDNPNRFK